MASSPRYIICGAATGRPAPKTHTQSLPLSPSLCAGRAAHGPAPAYDLLRGGRLPASNPGHHTAHLSLSLSDALHSVPLARAAFETATYPLGAAPSVSGREARRALGGVTVAHHSRGTRTLSGRASSPVSLGALLDRGKRSTSVGVWEAGSSRPPGPASPVNSSILGFRSWCGTRRGTAAEKYDGRLRYAIFR